MADGLLAAAGRYRARLVPAAGCWSEKLCACVLLDSTVAELVQWCWRMGLASQRGVAGVLQFLGLPLLFLFRAFDGWS